jgi:gamma-glutamyl hercynylcysteine S-oxide synthase
MPKQSRPDTPPDAADVSVRLKPILGIRPGTYLTVLYVLVLLLLVFFLLFSPGLRHRGAYYRIDTFPDKATVTVDGVYAGSTPCTIFLRNGDRAVEISKPYYQTVTIQEKVAGRVFATLLVMDRRSITRTLVLGDAPSLLSWALRDFQKNPQIPSIVSDAALAAFGATDLRPFHDFLDAARLFVTEESQLRELLLAHARVASRGAALGPGSYVSLLQAAISSWQELDNSPAWLMLILSRANETRLASTPWITQHLAAYKTAVARYYAPSEAPPASSPAGMSVGGMAFRAVPSGTLVMGKDDTLESIGTSFERVLPHPVSIAAFYLGATEVTNARYQSFVDANPQWSPENTAALVEKGLVTDTYLSGWKAGKLPSGSEDLPVTGISWHAAAAYCAWLSRSVQAVQPGYVARLPYESEWEWAARGGLRGMPYPLGGKPGGAVLYQKGVTGASRAGASEPNGYGLRDMLGNVWEWCADPFSPNASLLSSLDPKANASFERSLPDAPDRAVRGGSWANQVGVDKVYTRGSQPAEWCTPYLGFRVALARQ